MIKSYLFQRSSGYYCLTTNKLNVSFVHESRIYGQKIYALNETVEI